MDRASELPEGRPDRPLGLHPHDWLACLLLRREVEDLLKK
jgi:hypothetical protein